MIGYTAIAVCGITLGYLVGTRRARTLKKRLIQQLNSQSLDLLDARATQSEYKAYVIEQQGKQKAFDLCVSRLSKANKRLTALEAELLTQSQRHFIERSKIRSQAIDAVGMAKRATGIAREANHRLQHKANPTANTMEALAQKNYSAGTALAVNVVDNSRPEDRVSPIAPSSSHDTVRIHKSNNGNGASAS